MVYLYIQNEFHFANELQNPNEWQNGRTLNRTIQLLHWAAPWIQRAIKKSVVYQLNEMCQTHDMLWLWK